MISIIIATYNRATYIEETLKSIQNQTYTDFECIIVDDGSTDHTEEIAAAFEKADDRFIYVKRPAHIAKGANHSRNFGYSLSKGSHIKFFDSDDVMLPQHLETSMKHLEEGGYDFVVGDCINFDTTGLLERPYEIDRDNIKLSATLFATFKTAWITNDLLVKRIFADQIEFAGSIRDQASEYQYNIKLLLLTQNGYLINEILSHRRIHDDGFVVKARKDSLFVDKMNAELYYITALYLKDIAPKSLLKWLLSCYIQLSFKLATIKQWPENISGATSLLIKYNGIKGVLYPMAMALSYLTGKGYQLVKYVRKGLE
ncbi:glycosyltransferase family 2 protein [Nonlabens sp. MB-3u-79]|uniref:glycosyltransferase family 2 protein n=1 Tax=Nonlabens sp. MB-3u-79 TaxID=2058134 RepID=UPI000C30E4D3|nr:glycosyltransferase family 2 protein [Nonlabens sp. MB-3u-79]AUC77993.1 glycosyltransferase family 2 protein [Nonlabens sp. MB-3u-79]